MKLNGVSFATLISVSAAQCVLHGNCGPASRFGTELPCVNYTEPQNLLDKDATQLLTQLCGPDIAADAVCCTADQITDLSNNLKRVDPLIGSCPACRQNFFDVFCQFTCSPHQARFVEILSNRTTLSGKDAPKELNYFLDLNLAEKVYNSCSEVKFSAMNSRAMDLIGGGARNYMDFFKFLGDEKPLLGGSAFQINFPWNNASLPAAHNRQNFSSGYSCGQGHLKCSCMDCEESCPVPSGDEFSGSKLRCQIGPFQCVSLALVLSYVAMVTGLILLWLQSRRSRRQNESALSIQRLIQDDDHDEDDPFALPSSELEDLNLRSYRLNTCISDCLRKQGKFCARYPWLVIVICSLLILCASLGLIGMELESDPINLWVAPASKEATQRQFFNEKFDGGFYRTAQLFAVNETGPILQEYETLEWLQSVEDRVSSLRTPVLYDSLSSFCIKPLGDSCVVESVNSYGVSYSSTWKTRLQNCLKQPVSCLSKFGQPIDPHVVFGRNNNETNDSKSFLESNALVTTWVLHNSDEPIYTHRVVEWEHLVEKFFRSNVTDEASARNLRISFNVESSLERELQRSGQTDVKVIILSYVAMFAYVSLTLGDSIWLGLIGILVVLSSVTSAIGLLSLCGYRLTLVITEVIPFLALAIGVDNIFLIVHQVSLVSEVNPECFTIGDQVASAIANIGPSIVLSTSVEMAALAIAAIVPMPAVHNFAIFACVSILINSVLQLTLFVSLLVLHKQRSQNQLQLTISTTNANDSSSGSLNSRPQNLHSTRWNSFTAPESSGQASRTHQDSQISQTDPRRFSFIISTQYTPFLLGKRVKQCVTCFFILWLAFSLYVVPQLDLGLDQRFAVPKDSFLVTYFSDVYDLLGVGPPVYFVVEFPENQRAESREIQQKMCSRFSTCQTNSLVNILEMERKISEVSWLATAPASWIDDYFMWLNPSLISCCVENGHACYQNKQWNFNMTGFPENDEFTHYLNIWLDQPSDKCPLAGKAPYGQAISQRWDTDVNMTKTPPIGVSLSDNGSIEAAYFRTNHVPLRSQRDYIDAYAMSKQITNRITSQTGLSVFAYSIFYPFFAQYITIVSDSLKLVTFAIVVAWLLSWLLLGNLRTSLIISGVVTSLIINVCGLMYIFGISLNALSLVNLVICVGIAVEFCIHIARSFTFVPRVRAIGIRGFTKVDRAYNALAGTGGTIFGGVALTKFIGVCVLAFSHSKIFNIYYFRMWLALIICASLHSLVLLPVLLSVWGGTPWLVEAEGQGFADLEEL